MSILEETLEGIIIKQTLVSGGFDSLSLVRDKLNQKKKNTMKFFSHAPTSARLSLEMAKFWSVWA